jgi:hypothetical protein
MSASENENERWYSVDEFAVSFRSKRIGVDSVRRWIRGGRLHAFRFPKTTPKRGRRGKDTFMISESERQRFIRENTN